MKPLLFHKLSLSLYAVLYVEVLCQVKVDQQDFYCYKTLQMRTIMLSNPFSVDR
jgi:hypothetical protein